MPLTLTLEFSDSDLDYFRSILAQTQQQAEGVDTPTILEHARKALDGVDLDKVSGFVRRRLEELRALVDMLEDEDWSLEEQERLDVVSALAYFYRPQDLVADDVPVLGLLDDAIMTELVMGEMRHEIQAYQDYCLFRAAAATHGGAQVSREDWYKARKHEIFERMRNRLVDRQRTSSGSGKLTTFSLT